MKLISNGLALLPLLWLMISSARAEGLRAGAARIDVTPSHPVMMAGYNERTNLTQGVHDPISARALVFEQDGSRIVLVSLESLGFYNQTADPLRDAILLGNGLKPSELFLCAIHTHSAPTLAFDPKIVPQSNVDYTQELGSKLAELVRDALAHLTPVQIATGSGISPVGINRRLPVPQANGEVQIQLGRNPLVEVDHEVQVMKIVHAGGGAMTAALFDYPCHGTSLGPRNYLISGDIHGVAAQFLEKYLGDGVVTPEFAGASGDIDPWARVLPSFRTDRGWVPETVLLGTFLGEEVARVVDGLKAGATNCVIKSLLTTLDLPRKPPPANLEFASDKSDGINITVARLGDIGFVGLGGEVFNELGKAIKAQSPFQPTFVLTHCNGAAGYIPTKESYPSGGYEVASSQFAEGSGERVVGVALRMLKDLQ